MSGVPHDPRVLERNVQDLLRRCYLPALPAPDFRERLERLFLAELELRRGRRRRAPSVPVRLLIAAAAAILALFLGWRFLAGGERVARDGSRAPIVQHDPRTDPGPEPEPAAVAGASAPGQRQVLDVPAVADAAPAAGAPAARVLAGRVEAAATGEPVAGFTIALLAERLGNETPPPLTRAFPGEDGAFRWEDPPPGKQRVFVHAPGFALLALGEHELAGTVELQAELEVGASVRGIVLDPAGQPVAGALVLSEMDAPTDGLFFQDSERYFWLPIQAHSGPDGRFELAHLTPGTHTLRVSAPGFAPSWMHEVTAPGPARDELEIRLGPGGTIAGQVRGADGGPQASARLVAVCLDQTRRPRMSFGLAETDADGSYRFEHLPPTTMIVVLLRPDGRPDVRPAEVRTGEVARVDFAEEVTGVVLRGHVLDARGEPLAFQNLGLFDREQASWTENWVATATAREGGYRFEGVRPGRYLLFLIEDMGRGLRCVDEVEVPAWPELVHDVRLAAGRIAGSVHDGRTGERLSGAVLILEGLEANGDSYFAAHKSGGADGSFEFVDLRPGTYRVTAYPTRAGLGFGSSDPVQVPEVADAPPAETEVWLFEGGPGTVWVRDPQGRPLADALVVFADDAGAEHTLSQLPKTDQDGRYRGFGLRPGYYSARAWLPGHAGQPVGFELELGSEPQVNLVLAPDPAGAGQER